MKKGTYLFFAILFMAIISTSGQTKAAGVLIPNYESFEGEKMVLNGVGVREKFWMDMYAGALYLTSRTSNAPSIVAANEPMAIKLHIVSKLITSDKMVDAVNEGFNNSTNGNIAPLQAEIKKFKSFFKEEIKQNDVFDIAYLPSRGVVVYKNNNELGFVNGLNFKKALFGIWLSDSPADKKLKSGMLGN